MTESPWGSGKAQAGLESLGEGAVPTCGFSQRSLVCRGMMIDGRATGVLVSQKAVDKVECNRSKSQLTVHPRPTSPPERSCTKKKPVDQQQQSK